MSKMPQIETTRKSALLTIEQLVRSHYATLADIRQGKRFFRRGKDITQELYKRVEFEIEQCTMVSQAIQKMKAGDIQRAAALCAQIQEHILNVH